MECQIATRLVEKLVDGEATAEEKARAENHLEDCETCRAHYAFLMSIAELGQKRRLPEPKESYWESLSRNVLARIAEEKEGWPAGNVGLRARAILGGTAMRFAGLAAGVLLAVAVVWNVTSTRPHAPSSSEADSVTVSPRSATTPFAEQEEARAQPPSKAAAAPEPRWRAAAESREKSADRVTSEEGREPEPPVAAKSMEYVQAPEVPLVQDFEPAAQSQNAPRASAAGVPSTEAKRARAADEAVTTLGSASRLLPPPSEAEPRDSCEGFRQALRTVGEGEDAIDVRFQLARCELARYESEPSEEARRRALADGEAFLVLEPEGSRAEEIRQAISRVPR